MNGVGMVGRGLLVTLVAVVIGAVTAAPAVAEPPGYVYGVSATQTGANAATLTWYEAYDGGSPITGYVVSRDGTDTRGIGPYSAIVGSGVRSQRFTELAVGQYYLLSVQARNADGLGPVASVYVYIAGPVPPSEPTRIGYSQDDGAKTATLRWEPPASDGNGAILGYRVARSGTDGVGVGPYSRDLGADARSVTFGNLADNVSYQLSVQARNAAGYGPASYVTATVRPALPGAPTNFDVSVDDGARSATIRWATPASTPAWTITGYRVARSGTDARGNGPWSQTVSGTTTSQTFRELARGVPYDLSVQAITAAGAGASISRTVTLRAPSAGGTPTPPVITPPVVVPPVTPPPTTPENPTPVAGTGGTPSATSQPPAAVPPVTVAGPPPAPAVGGPAPATPAAPAAPRRFRVSVASVATIRGSTVPVRLTCPRSCRGTLRIETRRGRSRGSVAFRISAGTTTIRVPLSRATLRQARRGPVELRASATLVQGATRTTTRRTFILRAR